MAFWSVLGWLRRARIGLRFKVASQSNIVVSASWRIGCLLQPGQLRNRPEKSMRVSINPLIKSCATQTVPAAETKSIGLRADAEPALSGAKGCLIFCSPSRHLYRDMTIPAYLSGPLHLDNFIVTINFRLSTGTLPTFVKTSAFKAKTRANPDTPPAAGQAPGN